jgi:putative endonuclease
MIKLRIPKELYEMATISKEETGLPYDIWIDSMGIDRKGKHNQPRLKIKVNNNLIPISIEDNPRVLVGNAKKIKELDKIFKFIKENLEILQKHWQKELDDRETLNLIYYEACLNKKDAMNRERYLKTYYGKMYLTKRLKSYFTG